MKYRLSFFTILSFVLISYSCSYTPLFSPQDISSEVSVTETRTTIYMKPTLKTPSLTGLLFYPGGLVDSHVYNEILSSFTAVSGVPVLIVKMPANLAVFDIDAGLQAFKKAPEISQWIIAGHSLGGAMAASTVRSNPDAYKGIVFMDSYPADGSSLTSWSGAVLSLFSSVEKVNDETRMNKTLSLLPPAVWLTDESRSYPAEKTNYTVIHQINGGSHSYFGTYGPQDGDETPTITRAQFHAEVIDYIEEFFINNGWI